MKKSALFITLIVMVLGIRLCFANSVTYTISVTIPAIIGVNVPTSEETTQLDPANTSSNLETQYQEVVRHNQNFLLETIVAK